LESAFFYFSLAVLIAMIGGFFLLNYLSQKTDEEIASLTATLNKQKSAEEKALEDEVLSNQKRLSDFPNLLAQHKVATEFFRRLEGMTSPKISFTQLTLHPIDGTVNLGGETDSFESLGQQFLLFRDDPDAIQDVRITKVTLNTEGRVEFTFLMLLDPSVVNYSGAGQ